MTYKIYPDIDLDANDWELKLFPGRLSYFFEQVGGYGHQSEVSQVSQILKVDLDLFQHYDFMDHPDSDSTWMNIDVMLNKVIEFEKALKANPSYYEKVVYKSDEGQEEKEMSNEEFDKLMEKVNSSDIENPADLATILSTFRGEDINPQYCPEDVHYLSSQEINNDLAALRQNILTFKNNGAKRVRLFYS